MASWQYSAAQSKKEQKHSQKTEASIDNRERAIV